MSFVAEAAGGEGVLVVGGEVGASKEVARIATWGHLPPSLVALIHCVPPGVPKKIVRPHPTIVDFICVISVYLIVQTVQTIRKSKEYFLTKALSSADLGKRWWREMTSEQRA